MKDNNDLCIWEFKGAVGGRAHRVPGRTKKWFKWSSSEKVGWAQEGIKNGCIHLKVRSGEEGVCFCYFKSIAYNPLKVTG